MFLLVMPSILAHETCAVYFTGVGCPHCAKADPLVLDEMLKKYPEFIVIEYEVYQSAENAQYVFNYDQRYDSGLGIPVIIFEDISLAGDSEITKNIEKRIKQGPSKCPLITTFTKSEDLDINGLPGKPKIWTNDRVLIRTDGENHEALLKELLVTENLSKTFENILYKIAEPQSVHLSGKSITFENAIDVDGWLFQWNGEAIATSLCPSCPPASDWSECRNGTKSRIRYECSNKTDYECSAIEEIAECETVEELKEKLTMAKLLALAAVDAVNPCALAVLTLILLAILTYNPRKKSKILWAGLAFIISIFIMYMIYGLVIIKFFQLIQALTSIRILLVKILGIVAMLLGILNIKDFFKYKPGGAFTEMPLSMRPMVKKLISSVTSTKGAFIIGLFVTVFLLPCTIGPYVIAGGILSAMELVKTIPLLLIYNLIFIIPMVAIVLVVYAGISKVQDVSGWKDKNIRYLHLIAGIIIFVLGLAMLLGWI